MKLVSSTNQLEKLTYYTHNWSLQPFSQNYWLSFSHHLCFVCVNFINKWRHLQFKIDSEQQIFWETFQGNFNLLSEILPEIWIRKSPKKYFLYFVLMFLAWSSNPGFTSNKPTHYLLDYGSYGFSYLMEIRKSLGSEWKIAYEVYCFLLKCIANMVERKSVSNGWT